MSRPHHLYRYFDEQGVLLYVGISQSAFERAAKHCVGSFWFQAAKNMTIEVFPSRRAVADAERKAIAAESPKFNTAGAAALGRKFLLTDANIKALRLAGYYWDTEVPGLAVRVTERGAKSFALCSRLKLSGRAITFTVGACGPILVESARASARQANEEIAQELDPRVEWKKRCDASSAAYQAWKAYDRAYKAARKEDLRKQPRKAILARKHEVLAARREQIAHARAMTDSVGEKTASNEAAE